MKSRISPSSAKPSAFGAEGSAGLPNMPFWNRGFSQRQILSLPSPPSSELVPIKHTLRIVRDVLFNEGLIETCRKYNLVSTTV